MLLIVFLPLYQSPEAEELAQEYARGQAHTPAPTHAHREAKP